MHEFMLYINTLKNIIDRNYDREVVFYVEGDCEWYSREHGRNISHQELVDWALDLTNPHQEDDYDHEDSLPCGCCSCCGCSCNE